MNRKGGRKSSTMLRAFFMVDWNQTSPICIRVLFFLLQFVVHDGNREIRVDDNRGEEAAKGKGPH
jgi:hypothetical protein